MHTIQQMPEAFEATQSWQKKTRFLLIAGVGFFGDGYLNLAIGLGTFFLFIDHNNSHYVRRWCANINMRTTVVPMIGYLYFADTKNALPINSSDSIKGALSIGMIFGQVMFGFFGDAIGRHNIYGKELIITIFGTFMVIVAPATMSHTGIVAWLVIFRIFTGVGIRAG